jgi:hypothetical protein
VSRHDVDFFTMLLFIKQLNYATAKAPAALAEYEAGVI